MRRPCFPEGGAGGAGGAETKKPLLWKAKVFLFLSGRLDSNQRPPTPEAGALTGLRYTPNNALIVSRAHKDNPKIRNGKINFRKNRPDCGSGRRSDASCCGRRCAQPSAGPSRIPLHGLPGCLCAAFPDASARSSGCLCAAFPDASARFSRIPPHDLPGYLRMASFLFLFLFLFRYLPLLPPLFISATSGLPPRKIRMCEHIDKTGELPDSNIFGIGTHVETVGIFLSYLCAIRIPKKPKP